MSTKDFTSKVMSNEMRRCIRHFLQYTAVFLITLGVLLGALVLCAMIPREKIRGNMEKSAEILDGHILYYNWYHTPNDDAFESRRDIYADSMWLSIAYGYDPERPLESVMWSRFYDETDVDMNHLFLKQVQDDIPANTQYLRYWHGGNVLVQLFHLFTDIRIMYILNGIILAVLVAVLAFLLWKKELRAAAVGLLLSLAAVSIWYVPLCLEYTWVILWALICALLSVMLSLQGKWEKLGILFFVDGIVTIYLDFLTTETLALLFPLLLAMAIQRKESGKWERSDTFTTIRYAVLWLVGYVCMWVSKWGIASVVLKENAMPYVTSHVVERLGGDVVEGLHFSLPVYLYKAVGRNAVCVFPLNLRTGGLILFLIVLFLYAYACFVYRQTERERSIIILYAVFAAVPLLRIIVLHNHSFRHYFFTYRAFAGTILALILILMEVTEGRWLPRVANKRNRRGDPK